MKTPALLAACVSCLAVTALADTAPWKIPPAALKGVKNPVAAKDKAASVERGKALYAKECAGCHGDTGKGDGPDAAYFNTAPKDLSSDEVTKQSDAELFVKITQGKGDMKATEKLFDAKQRWDLVNAVRALR